MSGYSGHSSRIAIYAPENSHGYLSVQKKECDPVYQTPEPERRKRIHCLEEFRVKKAVVSRGAE